MAPKPDFAARRQWFETPGHELPQRRFVCPCCGYPTLSERNAWEICELCDWEDDGQDDPDAHQQRGGPNGTYSLTAARHNFLQHGHMYAATDRAAHLILRYPAQQALIAVFEAMVGETDMVALQRLWQHVLASEAQLQRMLSSSRVVK